MRFGARLPEPSLQLSWCDLTSAAQRFVSKNSQEKHAGPLEAFYQISCSFPWNHQILWVDTDLDLHYLYNVLTIYFTTLVLSKTCKHTFGPPSGGNNTQTLELELTTLINGRFKKAAVSRYCRFNNHDEKKLYLCSTFLKAEMQSEQNNERDKVSVSKASITGAVYEYEYLNNTINTHKVTWISEKQTEVKDKRIRIKN